MISQRQLAFLEYLIWKSRDADEFTKRCLIWLLRQSEGLTKAVRIRGINLSIGLHDMCSCNGTTHIDGVFGAAGSNMYVDYGGAAIRDSKTPWEEVIVLTSTQDEIDAIVPADPYKH